MAEKILQIQQVNKDELIHTLISAMETIVCRELENHRIKSLDECETWTTEQTAEFCKVSKVTIWEWTRKGILTKYKIGGRAIYKPIEVKAALIDKQGA